MRFTDPRAITVGRAVGIAAACAVAAACALAQLPVPTLRAAGEPAAGPAAPDAETTAEPQRPFPPGGGEARRPERGGRGGPDRERLRQPGQEHRRGAGHRADGARPRGLGFGWFFEKVGSVWGAMPPERDSDEWREVESFMEEHSPGRWAVFQQVLTSPGRENWARRFLYNRYTDLRRLRSENQKQYRRQLDQVQLEDKIFQLDTELRKVEATSPGQAESIRKQLQEKVSELVERDLEERENRIKRLHEQLKHQAERLEKDRSRMGELVERRVRAVRGASQRFRRWAAADRENGAEQREAGRRPGTENRGEPAADQQPGEGVGQSGPEN